ncbi:MAG: Tfp pilus assembly protein PilF [Colwellia sp.]|jgi:Tfp pilus assembly protein PilF
MLGCSSNPNDIKTNSVDNRAVNNRAINNSTHSTQVTLSHIKAYLLLGNIKKAEQLFQTIESEQIHAQAMFALAELHATKGNSIDAQKVFLSALADDQFELPLNKASIPSDLLDYFCAQKKWPALQGYGKAIISTTNGDDTTLIDNTIIKNRALTKIGLCFFYKQRWEDTKYWLEQVDLNEQVIPLTYLALARANIEQEHYFDVQSLITQYERTKDKVDAHTLWATIEVYMSLKQPDMATKLGENLRSIFPNNPFTRKYILLTKRGLIRAMANTPAPSPISPKPIEIPEDIFHSIKKGETLYQLSKRYGVTILQLQAWNPNLVIDNISLDTKIRLMRR